MQDSIHVSIIVPTFNRKEMLDGALTGLFNQSYSKNVYEIIVVDDGSTDDTKTLVMNKEKSSLCVLNYMRQENRGPAAARNLGIKYAKGQIIGFVDDDCIPSSTWIENALPYFKDPKIGGLVGCTVPIGEPKLKLFKSLHTNKITKNDIAYQTNNMFYRKKVLDEVGGFDLEFWRWQDVDLAHRVLGKGYKIDFGEDVVVQHRVIFRSLITHLKALKGNEFIPLLYKKHPVLKKNLTLGFIRNKKNIYPLFMVLILLSIRIGTSYRSFFFFGAALSYLWAHVLIDKNFKNYPLRILQFPRSLLPDIVRTYYSLRGSIKYRCLVI
jgi:glycosyltransferase involved in cell wall biosynthesis